MFLSNIEDQKIKALFKSYAFAKIYGGAPPEPLLRRVSNMVLLNPPPISQKRDLNKAGDNTRLAIFISKDAN